jgi:hypothetical protein
VDTVNLDEPQPIDLTALFSTELPDGEHHIHDSGELSLYATINSGKAIAWRIVDQQGQELQYQLQFGVPPLSLCELCTIEQGAQCVRGGRYGNCGAPGWGWSKPFCKPRFVVPCYLIAD